MLPDSVYLMAFLMRLVIKESGLFWTVNILFSLGGKSISKQDTGGLAGGEKPNLTGG
ncbi:MAG: hypothetical protein KKB74_08585 [Bacteroidetes bacterium]|nr:hypothetical protein [Bacteroidota bacterium]